MVATNGHLAVMQYRKHGEADKEADKDADKEARRNGDRTPLRHAVSEGHLPVAHYQHALRTRNEEGPQ